MHSGRGDVVIFIFIYLAKCGAIRGGGGAEDRWAWHGWWRHRSM